MLRPPPRPTLFPYTTLFRSIGRCVAGCGARHRAAFGARRTAAIHHLRQRRRRQEHADRPAAVRQQGRSEEHTSELQSRVDLVCRLLLEKKKKKKEKHRTERD